jgi:chromatin assembly factor 1 subunit A
MSRITETAEEGDYTTTSELAKLLADRKITPLRFMHFSHEGRPEYIGTWTKSSAIVGPRTPFAKDEAIDYEAEGIDAWLEGEEGRQMTLQAWRMTIPKTTGSFRTTL